MAPPKKVTEVPRTILPRLTWNGSSPRAPLTPSHGVLSKGLQKRQRIQTPNPLARKIHTFPVSCHWTPLSASCRNTSAPSVRGLSTSTRSPSKRPPVEAYSNPIRYNGVYAAAFKPARRAFHASAALARDHHFDTLKFVRRLRAEGFSEEQAVAMMRVLNDVIEESIQNLTRTMVLKEGKQKIHTLPITVFLFRPLIRTHRRRAIDLHPKSRFRETSL